jgi:hypothetical protein
MRWILSTFLAFISCALLTAPGMTETERPWFDLKGCAVCSKLDAEKGLMRNLHWEAHLISNGMLSVTVVPKAYEEALVRAAEGMEAALRELEVGEPKAVCGFCRSYGRLVMAGASVEEIDTRTGPISLITSTDPEVVAAIHDHARRAVREAKRVLESVASREELDDGE